MARATPQHRRPQTSAVVRDECYPTYAGLSTFGDKHPGSCVRVVVLLRMILPQRAQKQATHHTHPVRRSISHRYTTRRPERINPPTIAVGEACLMLILASPCRSRTGPRTQLAKEERLVCSCASRIPARQSPHLLRLKNPDGEAQPAA